MGGFFPTSALTYNGSYSKRRERNDQGSEDVTQKTEGSGPERKYRKQPNFQKQIEKNILLNNGTAVNSNGKLNPHYQPQ